jgi:hypothetical protein
VNPGGAGTRRESTYRALPRPIQSLVRRELRHATRSLRRELFLSLPQEQELEQISLHPLEDDGPAAGSRPQTILRDDAGNRYFFKLAPPELVAAELFAHRLRKLDGCLHVPTARRTLDLPGLGPATGMLQPEIPVVGALGPDPQRWSKLQREALLQEHPWEWLLANLDTHVDQYVLVGEHQLPINIDWDHALVDLAQTQLTRFNLRSPTIAPIRNLLYSEYVLGRLQLDFFGMQLQARKVAELSSAALTELVDRYADELALPDPARLELQAQLRQRKATLVADFDALVESLRHERDDNLGLASTPRTRIARVIAHVQDAWQRFVIKVLHGHVLRPLLRGYRALLQALARQQKQKEL